MINIKTFEEFGKGQHALFSNDSGDVFWGNEGAGCLIVARDTKKILVNLRSAYVNEPHTYGVWGGKIDEGDSIEDCVRGEVSEETAYDGDIDLIPLFVFENDNKTFKYHNFLGIIDEEFEPQLDWESEGYEWLMFDELLELNDKHPGLEALLNDDESLNIIKTHSI